MPLNSELSTNGQFVYRETQVTETGRRRASTQAATPKAAKKGSDPSASCPRASPGPLHRPDGLTHHAPTTFQTKMDARGWLALRHAEMISGK